MSKAVLDRLQSKFNSAIVGVDSFRGDDTALVSPDALIPILEFSKDDPSINCDMLIDITAVDFLGNPFHDDLGEARFQVVYHLYSVTKGHRVRLKVPVLDPKRGIESAYELWGNANWLEREVWDMYGIHFIGHPDLRRILMYKSFEGHPLRKDYPKEQRQPLVRRPDAEIEGVLGRPIANPCDSLSAVKPASLTYLDENDGSGSMTSPGVAPRSRAGKGRRSLL